MMDMIVEISLETVVSCEGMDDAALLVAAEHFKNNCFEFIYIDRYFFVSAGSGKIMYSRNIFAIFCKN